MADAMTYAFETVVTNSERNNTQNITGVFGTVVSTTFTAAACPAGTLCKKSSTLSGAANRLENEGYGFASKYNTNSWKMIAAADGAVASMTGDHTGIYACNDYDVSKLSGNGLVVNFPGKTLGLTVPAGEKADFCEIIVGEMYAFGYLNTSYSGTPDAGAAVDSNFAPGTVFYITDGKLTPTAGEGSRAGELAFVIVEGARFTEGAYDAGRKIVVQAIRVAAS